MNKAQILQVLLAVFIAIIFISSYFTFQGINPTTQSTKSKTVPTPVTVYGYSYSNALILSYNSTMGITFACPSGINASVNNKINNEILSLEGNSSIINTYPIQNGLLIDGAPNQTKGIFKKIYNSLNSTTQQCVSFSTYARVLLPSTATMLVGNQSYTASIPSNFSIAKIPITLQASSNSVIGIRIAALIEQNGTIYQMNVSGTE